MPDSPSARPSPSWVLNRLLLRLAAYLAAVTAVFLGYIALIFPLTPEARQAVLTTVGATAAGFGVVVLAATWWLLRPVRLALEPFEAGAPVPEALAARAARSAGWTPLVGAALTVVLWIVGGLVLEPLLLRSGIPSDGVLAGRVAGVCTGMLSALLFYYTGLAELFELRSRLPGPHARVEGAPIRVRIMLTSVAILLVGTAMVGVSAYLNHQLALERGAIESCDRALRTLVNSELGYEELAQSAATACAGSAEAADQGGRVRARVGEEFSHLAEGRAPVGVVLRMPLNSGASVRALLPDAARRDAGLAFAGQLALFAAIALLLAVAVARVASRAITAPVLGLAQGAEAVARGDLSRDVPVLSADELGSLASSFAQMSAGLRRMVQAVTRAAERVAEEVALVAKAGDRVQRGIEVRREGVARAIAEMTAMDRSVAGVGRDVSGMAEFVASTGAALAEFSAALDEVRRHGAELETAMSHSREEVQALVAAAHATRLEVDQLAEAARTTLDTIGDSARTLRSLTDAAQESERVTQRMHEQTASGARVVEEGVRGVEAIRGVVSEARARVQALGLRSADITAIVDFIAEVAGRTNLLSLNAAIIAAQAGEQGKPFGVVADQIRELAAQIGSSTKRIGDIIAGVRVEVEATSALIQKSDELAAAGVERAREGGLALQRIAQESRHARTVAASITPAVAAHAESARQVEQLAARVVDLAQGFAGVELLVRAGQSIEALAQSLGPLTQKVGQALEEQAAMSRRQVASVEEINRMMVRLNQTVAQHGEGTARALAALSALGTLTDEDRRAIEELNQASQSLTDYAADLKIGLERFRT